MSAQTATGPTSSGSLGNASVDRLACLLRHWTWADEAMLRFERELADGWDYDDDPMSDHPFGSYYHWSALLCAFAEAALDRGLLSSLQLDAIREDVEASLPALRASRDLLVEVPASLEYQPRIVELLHDDNISRLRRLHHAFGEALHREQISREIDTLDT